MPKDIQDRENDLVTRIAVLKYLRSCSPRRIDAERWENLTRLIEAAQRELDELIELLWRDYKQYAAIKYPRQFTLQDVALGDNEYALVLGALGEGVGVKLLRGRLHKRPPPRDMSQVGPASCRLVNGRQDAGPDLRFDPHPFGTSVSV